MTTIERTIADLVEDRTDLSLVADVLRDAAQSRRLDTERLAELLAPLAARNHLRKGDGDALLRHLTALAGLDTASLVEEISTSDTLSALVAADNLSRLSTRRTVQPSDRPGDPGGAPGVQRVRCPIGAAVAGSRP
ncbi:MAG: hypothetical protein V9E94_17195 [Microthrixaceae bacterium]